MKGCGGVLFEPGLAQKLGVEHVVAMPKQARGSLEIGSWKAEYFAAVAYGRADPIADDVGDHRSMSASVLLVDVLNDLLPSIVLDVEIDVWGFGPLDAQESLEQEIHADRIDCGDA